MEINHACSASSATRGWEIIYEVVTLKLPVCPSCYSGFLLYLDSSAFEGYSGSLVD